MVGVGVEDREQGPTVEAEQGAVGEHSLVIRGQQAHVRPPLRPARHQPLQLQSGLGLAMFYVEICLMMVLGCSRWGLLIVRVSLYHSLKT